MVVDCLFWVYEGYVGDGMVHCAVRAHVFCACLHAPLHLGGDVFLLFVLTPLLCTYVCFLYPTTPHKKKGFKYHHHHQKVLHVLCKFCVCFGGGALYAVHLCAVQHSCCNGLRGSRGGDVNFIGVLPWLWL